MLAVNEAVIAAGRCSGSLVAQKVSNGPEFSRNPDSGEVLHRPRIPSGLEMSVQEL